VPPVSELGCYVVILSNLRAADQPQTISKRYAVTRELFGTEPHIYGLRVRRQLDAESVKFPDGSVRYKSKRI